ncbi:MAG: TIGR04053 family radical SAM/SPASM domain-containing protein [Candidatus Thermoplasmatota archaeon]|nr:TIGR04053 family radical SAM/SPASM domain-containing protein [Candidatus Thermoplasmatota archaeon]MCL6003402.1 TIGR04053 family radical SAM/SPASM domain-containing protein [Candidatus Thermoplasmatota archaeon]
MNPRPIDYNSKPILIFWETTKACDLACKHCRASALLEALPDEMDLEHSLSFVEQIKEFGPPYPVLILTGGDIMKKRGVETILEKAKELGIPASMSPSATPLLNSEAFAMMKRHGVKSMSLSLDGASSDSHDWLRGYIGTFDKTLDLARKIIAEGFTLQINTTVFRRNVNELPQLLKILLETRVKTWEVFSLIKTGRGIDREDLDSESYEDVFNYLEFASRYGISIRTVEAPFFRRILIEREKSEYRGGELYGRLVKETINLLGKPGDRPKGHTSQTRDGKGIIFVAHNGDVNPSGFLPIKLGNVKERSIVEIYRNNEVLVRLRDSRNFKGRCGMCEYSDICGGSRSRAYSYFGDMFQEDPRCVYIPDSMKALNSVT